MPMYFGSRDGLKPRCDFTEEEAKRLIGYTVAEEIGEPTEYIDEVQRIVDEDLLDVRDGSEHPIIFRWDYETTGHLWKYDVRVRAALGKQAEPGAAGDGGGK
jgi:hypothetical protein